MFIEKIIPISLIVFPISRNPVNRGYWDPSESMRSLAEQIIANDPTKLPEGETQVTQENYFRIVSKERLGTEQPVHFQSGDQYGADWHWGSKYNQSGELIVSTDETNTAAANYSYQYMDFYAKHAGNGVWIENNKRSEMPRSMYSKSTDTLLNYYAATAESGSWTKEYGDAEDSVCPKGWGLPDNINDKSWHGLLSETYGFSDGSVLAQTLAKNPFMLSAREHDGIYEFFTGQRVNATSWYMWSKRSKEAGRVWNLQHSATTTTIDGYNFKSSGLFVRCVMR